MAKILTTPKPAKKRPLAKSTETEATKEGKTGAMDGNTTMSENKNETDKAVEVTAKAVDDAERAVNRNAMDEKDVEKKNGTETEKPAVLTNWE